MRRSFGIEEGGRVGSTSRALKISAFDKEVHALLKNSDFASVV